MEIKKIDAPQYELKLTKDELTAILRYIGNTSENHKVLQCRITEEENALLENIYDQIHENAKTLGVTDLFF